MALCSALARSYVKYGEDIRNGQPVGPYERNETQKQGFIPDGSGRRGKIVKTAKGGRMFKPEPMQNRPHPMPPEQVFTKTQMREMVSEESLNAMGWYRDDSGTWHKVRG